MAWDYEYTPLIWPYFASFPLFAVLGVYAFRRRGVPGATSFLVLVAAMALWTLGGALGHAAAHDETAIFWHKFNSVLLLPMIVAGLCFVVEYAGLGRWLSRPTLILLALGPLLFALLGLTNDIHLLVWRRIWVDGNINIDRGPANWAAIYYTYFLTLLHLMVLAWLFARSPRHRWIAGWLIAAPFIMRGSYFLSLAKWNPVAPLDPVVLAIYPAFVPYALAFFRFHMFDVVPVARDTVMEKMPDGVIVLDAEDHVAEINAKAKAVLGISSSRALGRPATDVFHAHAELLRLVGNSSETQCELSFGDPHPRYYQVHIFPLIDRRDFQVGRYISFHDITESKLAHALLIDQQRTLAVLEERELMAREVHDGVGQTLAAAYLQVKSASEFLARGDTRAVESCLRCLAEATQESKETVRDFLLGVKSRSASEKSFMTVLRQYFDHYSNNYGIHVEFVTPPDLEEKRFDLTLEAQLQPIIQEALTNVRKHSGASSARVIISLSDNLLRVEVEDDGKGFDPEEANKNQGFGLRSMRGRAGLMGGRLEVISAPNKGTRITFNAPWRKEER
jgi:PAS domain S-box-containing protein